MGVHGDDYSPVNRGVDMFTRLFYADLRSRLNWAVSRRWYDLRASWSTRKTGIRSEIVMWGPFHGRSSIHCRPRRARTGCAPGEWLKRSTMSGRRPCWKARCSFMRPTSSPTGQKASGRSPGSAGTSFTSRNEVLTRFPHPREPHQVGYTRVHSRLHEERRHLAAVVRLVVEEALHREPQGKTPVAVAHDAAELQRCGEAFFVQAFHPFKDLGV